MSTQTVGVREQPIALEVSDFVAGPFCGKLLSGLGFTVVKVQPPPHIAGGRQHGKPQGLPQYPEPPSVGLYLNIGKLSVTLDIEKPEGTRVFADLARRASVIVEDRPPGYMAGLGLSYPELAQANPRLVVLSLTPFGQTGPYSRYKSYYLNTYHSGGDGFLQGDSTPTRGPGYLGEYQAGVSSAIAAMAAYYNARLTGQGQHVDVSKQEALMFTNRAVVSSYMNSGMLETRKTRSFPYGGRFRCKDGDVIIVAQENAQWAGLTEVIGHPELAKDERFKDFASRSANSKVIRQMVEAWASTVTCDEAYRQTQAKRIPIGIFHDVGKAMAWPHFLERGFFQPIVNAGNKSLIGPTWPVHSSEVPRWPGPGRVATPGEHNEKIYGEWLDYNPNDLARLAQAGVI